jgi:hypothetical protein
MTNYVWTINEEENVLKAHIYFCEDSGPKTVLEFDLSKSPDKTNWIDCQRDSDNVLVFSWGHINSLTGSLQERFCFALDDDFVTNPIFKNDVSECPQRAIKGSKIDYRDHGNLMSVHHTVTDKNVDKDDRAWMHSYDICFGNFLVLSMNTDSRPIESVYGAAHDFFLLSPLSSSQTVQQWRLKNSEFVYTDSLTMPKSLKGDWSCLAALYK